MARLTADRANIDPPVAVVVLSIRAEFGDYDSARRLSGQHLYPDLAPAVVRWVAACSFATGGRSRCSRRRAMKAGPCARRSVRTACWRGSTSATSAKSRTRSGGGGPCRPRHLFHHHGQRDRPDHPPDAIAADPDAVVAQTEAARQTILTAAGIPSWHELGGSETAVAAALAGDGQQRFW